MEPIHQPDKSSLTEAPAEEEERRRAQGTIANILSILPSEKAWITRHFYMYQGFWYSKNSLSSIKLVQQHFKPRPSNVLLSSIPKAGTTWLKALCFSIMNRTRFHSSPHPLLTRSPHECVPFLEIYAGQNPANPIPDLPLVATHIPFTSLPDSVLASGCKIVYMVRNPKDVLVSLWHFMNKMTPKELPALSIFEVFELFCEGVSPNGPFWDHALGYWKASLELPENIYILNFEDMKRGPGIWVRKLAEFLGHPFSVDEEREDAVGEIIRLCSFDSLSNMEVNRTGRHQTGTRVVIENRVYFRQGEVGDWKNYLTPEMAARVDQITMHKCEGTGFTFCIL